MNRDVVVCSKDSESEMKKEFKVKKRLDSQYHNVVVFININFTITVQL